MPYKFTAIDNDLKVGDVITPNPETTTWKLNKFFFVVTHTFPRGVYASTYFGYPITMLYKESDEWLKVLNPPQINEIIEFDGVKIRVTESGAELI